MTVMKLGPDRSIKTNIHPNPMACPDDDFKVRVVVQLRVRLIETDEFIYLQNLDNKGMEEKIPLNWMFP